jgi:hypothetical protein
MGWEAHWAITSIKVYFKNFMIFFLERFVFFRLVLSKQRWAMQIKLILQIFTREGYFFLILSSSGVTPCIWTTTMVPSRPVDMFSPVRELVGFTSNGTKPEVSVCGGGGSWSWDPLHHVHFIYPENRDCYRLYRFSQGWLDLLETQDLR